MRGGSRGVTGHDKVFYPRIDQIGIFKKKCGKIKVSKLHSVKEFMIDDARLPLKQKFLEYFKKTPIQKFGAKHIGVDEDTITNWKKEDSDFRIEIDKLNARFVEDGLENIDDMKWKLERMFKQVFGQSSMVDITSGGKPLLGGIAKDIDEPEV